MKMTYAGFSASVLFLSCALVACDGRMPKVEASSTSKSVSIIPDATMVVSQEVAKAVDEAGPVLDDFTITAKAKWALAGIMEARSMEVFVETVEGHVKLSGNVASEAESQRASSLISSLEGVKGVENRLVVKTRI